MSKQRLSGEIILYQTEDGQAEFDENSVCRNFRRTDKTAAEERGWGTNKGYSVMEIAV